MLLHVIKYAKMITFRRASVWLIPDFVNLTESDVKNIGSKKKTDLLLSSSKIGRNTNERRNLYSIGKIVHAILNCIWMKMCIWRDAIKKCV